MNGDFVFRCAAVCLAVVLALAPYRRQLAQAANRALEAAKEKSAVIARVAAVLLLLAAAWGKVPLPSWPITVGPAVTVKVETPSDEMQKLVSPIAEAMRGMNPVDRAVWADTWTKAAMVVEGDAFATEVAFTDTRSLRAFTTLAIDIAWRRIGGKQPGSNEPLREAVESAYAKALGVAVVNVTKEMRSQYAEFARAVAWAGINRG